MSRIKHQKSVCCYFQIHQPYRLAECSFFDESGDHFTGPRNCRNEDIFEKVALKCYLPTTKLLLELLKKHPELRLSFSLSGTFLDQCSQYPKYGREIIELFQEMAASGQVEFLAETYFHSLSFLYSKAEYAEQINLHREKIASFFGQKPRIFRNTELIYSNELGEFIRRMGFQGMLCEGWDHFLQGESSNFVYNAKTVPMNVAAAKIAQENKISGRGKAKLPLLLKNYKLSDDIAFRFGNKEWIEHPLTSEKFATWAAETPGETINLFMDYETFGEHQWSDTGIFEFLRHLPAALLAKNIGFHTPSEALKKLKAEKEYDVPTYLSWADTERDLSAWLENDLQRSALTELALFEQALYPWKNVRTPELEEIRLTFGRLQTSDHLYYMSTKYWSDGDVHKYFSAYVSPYEAYINFMNTLRLLKRRFEEKNSYSIKNEHKS